MFISYHDESSDSETEDNVKETSIDGIFIEFDNNIPKVVDKKRCSHISALARVTCVHHRGSKFVKRRATSSSTGLKSKSCEKMQDDKNSLKTNKRPMSADTPLKKTKPTEPEKVQEAVEAADPLSYLLNTRAYKLSRESLSDSTESFDRSISDSNHGNISDNGSDADMSGEKSEAESNKENEPEIRNRRFSVDEHFLEEGRYHQVKELDTCSLRAPSLVSS